MLKELFLHGATVFGGFLAIMNPVANTPLFLSLTAGADKATRRQVARNSLLLAFIIVVVFCAAGRIVFELFGIAMPAFKITGGLLVFLVGFHMLQGEQSSMHRPSKEDEAGSKTAALNVAVSPLAVPILAGPGTIATAMNFTASGGISQLVITSICYLILCVITYYFFVLGQKIVGYIGPAAINAITRMMGMILAVIGTQMVIDGVTSLLKATK